MYILDEVHMLSKNAWNALLKTLEEPPQHVIFALATTEPHKVPATVVSRTEVLRLTRPHPTFISELLQRVVEAEGSSLDAAAIESISANAPSYRDALGMLQQRLYGGEAATTTDAPQLQSAVAALAAGEVEALHKFLSAEAVSLEALLLAVQRRLEAKISGHNAAETLSARHLLLLLEAVQLEKKTCDTLSARLILCDKLS
jgi:DNA polymerase-3 subunit gamma/tau